MADFDAANALPIHASRRQGGMKILAWTAWLVCLSFAACSKADADPNSLLIWGILVGVASQIRLHLVGRTLRRGLLVLSILIVYQTAAPLVIFACLPGLGAMSVCPARIVVIVVGAVAMLDGGRPLSDRRGLDALVASGAICFAALALATAVLSQFQQVEFVALGYRLLLKFVELAFLLALAAWSVRRIGEAPKTCVVFGTTCAMAGIVGHMVASR